MNTSELKRWYAPAKLNLFLHITGRRDDGYHLLQTVFQFLDYADEIQFQIRDDAVIQRVTPITGVTSEQDLMVKAARLLRDYCGCDAKGVDIYIDKRLPMGGGLGGGSSDAATTLVALNQLWVCGLEKDELARLGLQLGADVPVFINGEAVWAEGVGEEFTPINVPEDHFLVIVPPVHISTVEIFSDPLLTRDNKVLKVRDFFTGQHVNVCEEIAIKRYPEVSEALDFLRNQSGHCQVRMTGTGSCVFAQFKCRADAEKALNNLPGGWEGFLATGCNKSLLHNQI